MAEQEQIDRVRRLAHLDPLSDDYPDDVLENWIDDFGVYGAVATVYDERANETAGLVDVTEGSSSRKLSQASDGYAETAARWWAKAGESSEASTGTRVHQIVRD